jgi:hypothetical protein
MLFLYGFPTEHARLYGLQVDGRFRPEQLLIRAAEDVGFRKFQQSL